MRVRLFARADADALAALFHDSVQQAGIRDYSPEQVAAWSETKPDPEQYLRRAEGRMVFVVEGDSCEPIGYGDLEPSGHIDHLYCRPDRIGAGVGSALLVSIEAAAKAAGITTLFIEASEAARRLLERRGFVLERRHDFILRGVAIHNYRMSKVIS